MAYVILLVLAPTTALVSVGLLRARRPGTLSALLSLITLALLILWVVNSVFIATDFQDADGFTDCSQSACSALQVFTGVTFGVGIVIFVGIALVALLAAAFRRGASSEHP
jgi:hypothetical protein